MKNTVRIVGSDSKYHRAPVFIVPKLDKFKKVFTVGGEDYPSEFKTIGGVEVMTCHESPLHLTEESQFKFQHLDVFDMDSDEDRFRLQILKDSDMVATSKYEINPVEHRFYVEDLEADSKRTISLIKLKREAINAVADLSLEEMQDLALLLGRDLKHMTSNQIEAYLDETADENPRKVLTVLKEDEKYKIRVFLRKIVSHGVIKKEGEKHTYGSQLVGINEDYAIDFVENSENRVLVVQWAESAMIKPPFTEAKKTAPKKNTAK